LVQTPQIVPGGSNDASSTPIVTWGSIMDTPMVLDDENRPKEPLFKVPAVPNRDRITNALSRKNAKKLRAKEEAKRIATTPGHLWNNDPPPTGSYRAATGKRSLLRMRPNSSRSVQRARTIDELSPAARKLMEERTGGKTPIFRQSAQQKTALGSSSVAHSEINNIERSSTGKWSRMGSLLSQQREVEQSPNSLKHTPNVLSEGKESHVKVGVRKLNSGKRQKMVHGHVGNLKRTPTEAKLGKKRSINQTNLTDGLL